MKKVNKIEWLPMQGSIKASGSNLEYEPLLVTEGPQKGSPILANIRSSEKISNGKISFKAQIESPSAQIQIQLNAGQHNEILAGLNIGPYGYGIAHASAGRWEYPSGAGSFSKIEPGVIEIGLVLYGQTIELYINNVLAATAYTTNIWPSPIGLYIWSTEKVLIEDFKVERKQKSAFVIMQFTDEFNEIYQEVIKPAVESFDLECIRADDIYNSTPIINDILQSIRESSVIIADITPTNANVFYEVGYAHGINKPVILMSDKKRGALPFDVSGIRTLFYENSIGGKGKIDQQLKKHLETILSPSPSTFPPSNSVI